jgi:hypothetical protein
MTKDTHPWSLPGEEEREHSSLITFLLLSKLLYSLTLKQKIGTSLMDIPIWHRWETFFPYSYERLVIP